MVVQYMLHVSSVYGTEYRRQYHTHYLQCLGRDTGECSQSPWGTPTMYQALVAQSPDLHFGESCFFTAASCRGRHWDLCNVFIVVKGPTSLCPLLVFAPSGCASPGCSNTQHASGRSAHTWDAVAAPCLFTDNHWLGCPYVQRRALACSHWWPSCSCVH